jgi:hypothetical protein
MRTHTSHAQMRTQMHINKNAHTHTHTHAHAHAHTHAHAVLCAIKGTTANMQHIAHKRIHTQPRTALKCEVSSMKYDFSSIKYPAADSRHQTSDSRQQTEICMRPRSCVQEHAFKSKHQPNRNYKRDGKRIYICSSICNYVSVAI